MLGAAAWCCCMTGLHGGALLDRQPRNDALGALYCNGGALVKTAHAFFK
jgi:hypothetical protein